MIVINDIPQFAYIAQEYIICARAL